VRKQFPGSRLERIVMPRRGVAVGTVASGCSLLSCTIPGVCHQGQLSGCDLNQMVYTTWLGMAAE